MTEEQLQISVADWLRANLQDEPVAGFAAVAARIIDKIEICEPDACWRWRGAKNPKGYGHASLTMRNGKKVFVYPHRAVSGADRKSLACHKCDNPSCVNPSHLFVGTQVDNMQDAIRKGRHVPPPIGMRGFANRQTEDQLQIAVVNWLSVAAPGLVFWHTPNGGQRAKKTAARLKMMGTKPGIPDLTFILDGGKVAFIELKTAKGRLSEDQKAFRDTIKPYECPYAVCRSIEEVDGTLRAWGVSIRGRIAA